MLRFSLMAPSVQRCLVCVLLITALALGVVESSSSVVREIAKLKQVDDIPKLAHITIAGVRDGQKEVEAWVETVAPGGGTPIHRHDQEEIFIIQKGAGTVYIASPSENNFPGEPVATPFSANSSFSIPPNAVHQVRNTGDEDCQFFVVISKPPMQAYVYKTWDTLHKDAFLLPLPWDQSEKDEL